MIEDFDEMLEEDIAGYEGDLEPRVRQIPSMFRLLVGLLDDPELPLELRPMVLAGLAYFIIPSDIIPDDREGVQGYLDDFFVAAWIANEVRKRRGEGILLRHWEGDGEIGLVVERALEEASEYLEGHQGLSGDAIREAILDYLGSDAFVPRARG